MQARLEEIFPIMEIDEDCIMSKMGEISIVFKTELPEIFSLSQQDYEILHQCWLRALKALPENSILHKQDWFFQSSYKADLVDPDQSFLSRSSELHFNERPYLQHSCYLMLTKVPEQRKPASSLFSTLLRGGSVPQNVLQESYKQEFLDCCAQFSRILEDSGMIHLRRLTQEELMSSENDTVASAQQMRCPKSRTWISEMVCGSERITARSIRSEMPGTFPQCAEAGSITRHFVPM